SPMTGGAARGPELTGSRAHRVPSSPGLGGHAETSCIRHEAVTLTPHAPPRNPATWRWPVIELFGVGAHTETGAWLFRRVTAGFERGEVTFVMSSDRAARVGLLDVAAAASIATEGRAWITGAPVMRETRKAIARRVGNVRLDGPPAARTSV